MSLNANSISFYGDGKKKEEPSLIVDQEILLLLLPIVLDMFLNIPHSSENPINP